VKAAAWQQIVGDDRMSNRLLTATAAGFWHPTQVQLTQPYVGRYFEQMPAVAAGRPAQLLMQLASAAFPRYAVAPQTVAAAQQVLGQPGLHPVLRRVVMDAADEMRRALAARQVADGRR
jgi:aminopeptidase N